MGDLAASEMVPPRSPDLVALGEALEARASEGGQGVVARSAALLGDYPAELLDGIRRDTERQATFSTAVVGHLLATGEPLRSDDWRRITGVARAPVLDGIRLADMTKLYLSWRDVCLDLVGRIAAELGTPDAVRRQASDVVRAGSDASLVRTVKAFDVARRELEERLAEEQARLAHMARHDGLTGLPNRAALFERLAEVVAECHATRTAAAVLFIDLDGFKAINDRCGHSAGDRLLVEVGERLLGLVRPTDTIARLGGDEFVALAVGLEDGNADGLSLAARIHEALAEPFPVDGDGTRLVVSASIGLTFVAPGDDPERLISQADRAMYQAKQSGGALHRVFEHAAVVG